MVSSSCACSSCCNEFSRHLVLPFPPEDEDTTHADFRASLFESLGLEITSIDHALLPPKEHGGPLQCQTQNLHSDEQLRLLRVCSCLCDCCIRVSCGAWLDALRVNDASDSELYFFQGHLQAISKAQSREADDTGSWANKGKAAKCLQCAEGRTNGKREEAWGLLAGCAGPFSFRHCLAKMQKPPEMLLFRGRYKREGHTGVADSAAARYAKQGTRLFSLFCAPANVVRPSTPDEQKTAILRASASELGAYIHPSVQVATFEREGRGILAADKLHQGDLLLRMPATTLVNVYTALTHPTFSLLAQVLLGLPADQLQQSMEGIGVSPTSHEHQRHQQTTTQELQSLVDCDVVVCIFLLFLAFAAGQEGGKALLRFLPPANADDAACTAKALCPSRAAAAAAAAEKEALLLSDPEDVLKFLGDEALADAMHRSIAKCSMMQHQLLPLLHQAFPPPPDTPQIGVLATCRAAAAAAAGKTTRVLNGFASGAVAAAADVGADTIAPLGSPLNKKDLLCAFVGQLNYSDFLWAHLVLESRSFSLRLLPQAPLTEIGSGPNEGPPKDSEEGQQDTEEDTEEELTVPFLPELCDVPPMNEACSIFLPVKVNGEAPSRFHVRIPRRCASLVPLGELLNHHPHGQVLSPSMEEEGRWLCLRLACDVPMGAQLFAHYGPLQSWQFLGYFGFCPSSFPHLEPPPQLLSTAFFALEQKSSLGSSSRPSSSVHILRSIGL